MGAQLRQIFAKKVSETGKGFFGNPPSALQNDLPFSSVIEVVPEEFARQLTLIEFSMFEEIRFEECFGMGWAKKANESKSPNIIRMIQQFNKVYSLSVNFVYSPFILQISQLVIFSILSEQHAHSRTQLIHHFLDIAEACLVIGNFNSAFEISSALGSSSIRSQKSTFAFYFNIFFLSFSFLF